MDLSLLLLGLVLCVQIVVFTLFGYMFFRFSRGWKISYFSYLSFRIRIWWETLKLKIWRKNFERKYKKIMKKRNN